MFYVKNDMFAFSVLLKTVIPFILIYVSFNNYCSLIILLLMLLFIDVACYLLKSISEYIGKGDSIPLPENRFTEVSNDGEVSIDKNRLQELLLYVADLEDYLERKGMLK